MLTLKIRKSNRIGLHYARDYAVDTLLKCQVTDRLFVVCQSQDDSMKNYFMRLPHKGESAMLIDSGSGLPDVKVIGTMSIDQM